MSRGTIGFDLDGVVFEYTGPMSCLAGTRFPRVKHRPSGAQRTWALDDLSPAEEAEVWELVHASEGEFWRTLPALVSQAEMYQAFELDRAGYSFVYVTARPGDPETVIAASEWALGNLGMPVGPVHVATDKAALLNTIPDLLGMIDDSPHGCAEMWRKGVPVYVRDWPYNRELTAAAGYVRVNSVGEYLAAVTQ